MVQTEGKIRAFATNLKNGTEVLIREAVIQDATELIRCVKNYISGSNNMVMQLEEFAPDLIQGREFIQNFTEHENALLIVAICNDKIIGNLDITGGRRKRLMHTGLVGMGMLQEYRGNGLGSVLLQTGIDWAKRNTYLEKLWLQVLANNESAIQLYKKFGFTEEGRQLNFVKFGNGRYIDNILMSRNIK